MDEAIDQLLRPLIGGDVAVSLLALGMVTARVSGALWLTPFLGGRLIPGPVKLGLALLFAGMIWPHVLASSGTLSGAPAPVLAGLVAKEVLVGAALGFTVAVVFWAAEAAGRLADSARGATMAEALVPQTGLRSSPLGSLYYQLVLVVFIVLGGHRLFVVALAGSYEVLPLAAVPEIAGVRGFALLALRLTADLLLIALSLSAPIIAALFITDATLGLINRFAPQLSVFFLAMPAKAALGILVLALSVGVLLSALPLLLDAALQSVHRALDLMAP